MIRFVVLTLLLSGFGLTSLTNAAPEDQVPLTILHWNDLHSANVPRPRVVKGDTVLTGGVAALGGYLNHYRATLPNVIALNAGDDYQGTPISSLTEGRSQVAILNLLQPDAFALGNHEFDYTEAVLLEAMEQATFPVLLGNVVREADGSRLFPADTVLTVGGVKVGVISVMSSRFREMTTQAATEGLEVLPAADVIRASLSRLDPITDLQIVLSHSGVDEDSLIALELGSEIEMIVGGHSHSLLWEPLWVNGVPIVQAGSRARWLGVVELVVDTLENRVVSLDARVENVLVGTYPDDEAVAALVEEQEAQLAEEMDKVIAEVEVPLESSRDGSESNIGNWIADCFRASSGADIAAINQHGIRANVDAGPLTVREVYEVSPFGNTMMSFSLTGADLKRVVLFQASEESSRLQISGMRYHVRDGEIVSLEVGGEQVNDETIYRFATINYVTDHFDSYFGLDPSHHPLDTLNLVDRDVIIQEAKAMKMIHYTTEGRFLIEK